MKKPLEKMFKMGKVLNMPHRSTVSSSELKDALLKLSIVAGGCMKNTPTRDERVKLKVEIRKVKQLLEAATAPNNIKEFIHKPQELIAAYMAAGGDWKEFIIASRAHGRTGQTQTVAIHH
jgi:hypothetical protein